MELQAAGAHNGDGSITFGSQFTQQQQIGRRIGFIYSVVYRALSFGGT